MSRKTATGGGLDAVFEAIDELTAREHRQFASLLHMQSDERDLTELREWEDLLRDATESALEPEEDGDD